MHHRPWKLAKAMLSLTILRKTKRVTQDKSFDFRSLTGSLANTLRNTRRPPVHTAEERSAWQASEPKSMTKSYEKNNA